MDGHGVTFSHQHDSSLSFVGVHFSPRSSDLVCGSVSTAVQFGSRPSTLYPQDHLLSTHFIECSFYRKLFSYKKPKFEVPTQVRNLEFFSRTFWKFRKCSRIFTGWAGWKSPCIEWFQQDLCNQNVDKLCKNTHFSNKNWWKI